MPDKVMGNLTERTRGAGKSPTAGTGTADPTQGGYTANMAEKTRNAPKSRNRDNGQMPMGGAYGFGMTKKTR